MQQFERESKGKQQYQSENKCKFEKNVTRQCERMHAQLTETQIYMVNERREGGCVCECMCAHVWSCFMSKEAP